MLLPSPMAEVAVPDPPAWPEPVKPLPFRRHLLLIAAALAVWAGSLPFADLARLNGYGLLPRLPVTFLLAVFALCVGFVLAARRSDQVAERIMLLYLVALVVVCYATIPLLYDEPRYAFVYKHIAVIHYIETHGSVDRSIDIYQNWPGFFALNAVISQVTGVDALRYANWTQVLFPLADLFALRFVFSGLTSDRRRIHLALLIFVLGAWVEYGYLAPQSVAFFLTLVILGVILRWLRPDPAEWHQRLLAAVERRVRSLLPRWSRRPDQRTQDEPERSDPAPARAAVIALVLAMSIAIITAHQLTPFFLVLDVGLLVLARRCRTWWLPLAIVALTVVWIGFAYDYLAVHFPTLFGGSPVANVQPSNHPVPGVASDSERFIGSIARGLTLVIGVSALAGAWRDHRLGRRQNVVLALAATPVALVLVQSYGGESIYRVYMFMVPWLAYLAAGLFAGAGVRLPLGRAVALIVGSIVAASLFLTSYYGLEHENYMPKQEVAATEWFDAKTPQGSVLMLMIENHPYPLGGDYDQHLALYGHYAAEVLTDPDWANRPLTSADVGKLHDLVVANAPKTYLMLSPSQIAYAENHGYARPGSLAPFFAELAASKQFEVVFHQEDSYVLRPR